MKKLTLAFLLITLSFAAFSQEEDEINELCMKANISTLKFYGIDDLTADNRCEKKVSELNNRDLRTLQEIYSIHEKAADLFSVSIEELFEEPLAIEMLETTLGSLSSSAGGRAIAMGVFPNGDYVFNHGVYVHELGHILSGSGNKNLPIVLEDLGNSNIFLETFADLLSLTLYNQIIIPVKGEESCLDRMRYIGPGLSYNIAQEYFLEVFSFARIQKCCESYTLSNPTKNQMGLCHEIKNMSESYQKEWVVDLTIPFDPLKVGLQEIDNHQIGLPILSFFKDFGRKTNHSFRDLFKIGFTKENPTAETYTCSLTLKEQLVEKIDVSIHTVRTYLNDIRSSLSLADQMTYDLLYSKHAIEKGLQFGDRTIKNAAGLEVIESIALGPKDHLCFENINMTDFSRPEMCQITCERKTEL